MNTYQPPIQKQIYRQEEVVRAFFRLLQTVKIHNENNRMLVGCTENLVQTIEELAPDEDYLNIRFVRRRLYFQEEKMVYRPETERLYNNLSDYFENRRIQGIRIYTSIRNAPIRDVLMAARILNYAGRRSDPDQWLEKQLSGRSLPWLELIREEEAPRELQQRGERAKRTYAGVLRSVRDVAEKLSSGKGAGISPVLRMAQGMVDLMLEDESLFRLLSTLKVHDDYTYVHSVNVAILAMCMGRRIMLSRSSLERLGICGLLHDLGKIEVPPEILNKPGRLTADEFREISKHSINSARLIARIQASRDRKARILLPPFEHHMKYDLSGYPRTRRKAPLTLFGRILSIVDVYDAVTSPRVYRKTWLSPDRALGMMLEGSGRDFDPVLLKVFINMMGVYPIGTLLKLDRDGEIGLVVEASGDADGRLPKVLLLEPDGQGGFCKGEVVDLREKNPETGQYMRNIIQSHHPSRFDIQAADYLL